MVDLPDRSAYGADDRAEPNEEQGWGSPVPAEYGSLRAMPVLGAPSVPVDRPEEYRSIPAHPLDHDSAEAHRTEAADPLAGDPEERWAVTSLLRRIQGESGLGAPAFAGAPAPEPVPAPVGPPDEPPAPSAPMSAPVRPAEGLPFEGGIDPDELGPELAGPLAGPPPDAILGGRYRRRPRPSAPVPSRAAIRHVDIGSVVRVSVVFWAVILVALVLASFLLWLFADAFGSLPSIEKSVRTLFSLKSFKLHPATVALYTALAGVVLAIAGVVANVIMAMIYNLIADVVGGIHVELGGRTRD